MRYLFKPKFNWFDIVCFTFTSYHFMETGNYWWIALSSMLGLVSAAIELVFVVGDSHVSE